MINQEFYIPEAMFEPDELSEVLGSVVGIVDAPAPVKRTRKDWPQHFVMELALGLEDVDTLCIRYDITTYEYTALLENATFQRDLVSWRQKMADEGLSFKLKARVQAEEYLAEIDNIIHDPLTAKETKLNAISRIVEWGGLYQKNTEQTKGSGTSITINITKFSDDDTKVVQIN